jgi:uncharacterized lipoprotein YehR (DUF1307 family)
MKTKNRIFLLLMVMVLSIGLLEGCGKKEENQTSYQKVKNAQKYNAKINNSKKSKRK